MREGLPASVQRYIRGQELLRPGERVLVAVSGGADSVALLRVLMALRAELGIVLAVAHFNHQLRGEDSDADQAFVVDLAQQAELDFFIEHANVAEHASTKQMSLEAAGRELRYTWLGQLATEKKFEAVATAHTLDDQAETVLMKFLRGAGTRGLAGIYPQLSCGATQIHFVRPLLGTTRAEVESYLTSINQPWREDESNLDQHFRRNRVRHELLPRLERYYNSNVRQVLSETAEINRAEEDYWKHHAEGMLSRMVRDPYRLELGDFPVLPTALQRHVLKRWLENLGIPSDFAHVERLRTCAMGSISRAELADDWLACGQGGSLVLHKPDAGSRVSKWPRYEYTLPVPGEVMVLEIGCIVRAVPVIDDFRSEAEPGTLLRADLIGSELCVRNWQPGDRYRPAYSRSEQKLKRLFSERKIPLSERVLWPVVLQASDIVWVRGFPVSESYCWRPGNGPAVRIECSPCTV